nr:hypothetical protein [Tanacetum cinerariifolium]
GDSTRTGTSPIRKAFASYSKKFESVERKRDIQCQLERMKKHGTVIKVLAHTQVTNLLLIIREKEKGRRVLDDGFWMLPLVLLVLELHYHTIRCKNGVNHMVLSLAPKFTKSRVLNLSQDKPQLDDNAVETIANNCHDLHDLMAARVCGCGKAASDKALEMQNTYLIPIVVGPNLDMFSQVPMLLFLDIKQTMSVTSSNQTKDLVHPCSESGMRMVEKCDTTYS